MTAPFASRAPLFQARVAVILLNYNGHEDTRDCLASLAAATCRGLHVIVCDNGSSRPGLDALEAAFPAARFIRNPTNLGFAAGCNVGIAAARGEGTTHVVLLNNDTIVAPGFAEPLLDALERDPRAGVAGGTVLQWDGAATDRVWYAGGGLSKWRGEITRPGFGGRFDEAAHTRVVRTGFVSGCLAAIPIRILDQVGTLDEDFFFGVEDLEFTWRLEQRGYHALYVPHSVIWHRSGRSRSLDEGEIHRAYAAKLLMQRKRRGPGAYWVWLAAYTAYMRAAGLARTSSGLAALGYAGRDAAAVRAAVERAIRDAWRGRLDTRAGLPR